MSIIELFTSIDRQTFSITILGFLVVHLIVFGVILLGRSHAITKVVFGTAAASHIALMFIIYSAVY